MVSSFKLKSDDLSWVQLRPWAELHWAEVGLGRVILHPPPTKQAKNRVLKHQLLPYSKHADETWPRVYIYSFSYSSQMSMRFQKLKYRQIKKFIDSSLSNVVFIMLLFDLILYVPSTISQLNREGSSWVETVLS